MKGGLNIYFLKRNFRKFFFFAVILSFSSCELINPKEEIPSWLSIENFNLTTTANQGSNSHKISDIWVYVDDQPIGAFELPSKFPILNSGEHKLTIKAGIKINGIYASRGVYPFFEPVIQNINFKTDSIKKIVLSTKYYNEVNFLWMENFENSGISLTKDVTSDTSLLKTSNPDYLFKENNSFPNYYAGIIELSSAKPKAKVVTTASFANPKKTIFLEFNYLCNQEFTVGYLGISKNLSISNNPVLVLNPSTTWNKMYLNLTSTLASETADEFKIFFEAQKPTTISNSLILLDNIKLIYL